MAQSVDLVLHSTIDNPALVEHIRSHGVEWYRRGWKKMPFNKAFLVNPLTKLNRNTISPCVEVSSLDPGYRSVHASKERTFHGSGSRFMDGDTLMARITPCLENGKIARYCSKDKTVVVHGSTEFIVIRGRPGISDSNFAFYMTCSATVRDFAINQMTGTSGRQRVPTESLAHLTVRIPPLPEQKAIAHILGTLDDKIELNRKTNETLEAMARALFKSWFVDFDPVRAKAEGRSTGLPDEISALFPDSFEDSELGEIPRGWEVGTISELIDIDPARMLAKGSIASYLEMKSISISGHIVTGVYPRKFTSGTKFQLGDTLLARITPCLENGKTAPVDFLEEGKIRWGSTEFIVMCGKKSLHNSFVYCLARSEAFRSHAIRNMVGSSGRQRVPSNALAGFQMSLPPDYLVDCFSVLCRSFLKKINKASAESATLSSIRDTFLPKLISGEICIPEAKTIAKEVV